MPDDRQPACHPILSPAQLHHGRAISASTPVSLGRSTPCTEASQHHYAAYLINDDGYEVELVADVP